MKEVENVYKDQDKWNNKIGLKAVRSKYNWSFEFENLIRCYNNILSR